jgi:hypothetical protein
MSNGMCQRCKIISMKDQEGKEVTISFSVIQYLGESVTVCPLCLNETRRINTEIFDGNLKKKNLN